MYNSLSFLLVLVRVVRVKNNRSEKLKPVVSGINFGRLRSFAGAMALFAATLLISVSAAAGKHYYLDCNSQNNAASGLSQNNAWRDINRANDADLQPGDKLLLKRGCIWEGQTLRARWQGTANSYIRIRAYGIGKRPRIHNGGNNNIRVSGSYQSIEDVTLTYSRGFYGRQLNYGDGCYQPIASTYGINFVKDSHHNVIRNSGISGAMAGVHMALGSHHNRVKNNKIHDNRVMQNNKGDLGAWGILINGDSNEISNNEIYDNVAYCPNISLKKLGSNAVELYRGDYNRIHHNYAHGDRVFSEMGSSQDNIARGNVYAYNLFVSNIKDARFIVTRGSGKSFGPVIGTVVENNTVYMPNQGSEGLICAACSANILRARSNIIWATEKVVYANGGAPVLDSNLFWSTNANPVFQGISDSLQRNNLVVNPEFESPAGNNFRLNAYSPAINAGSTVKGRYGYDLDGNKIGTTPVDIGAYEFVN